MKLLKPLLLYLTSPLIFIASPVWATGTVAKAPARVEAPAKKPFRFRVKVGRGKGVFNDKSVIKVTAVGTPEKVNQAAGQLEGAYEPTIRRSILKPWKVVLRARIHAHDSTVLHTVSQIEEALRPLVEK